MRSVEEEWESFARAVLPPNCSTVQRWEMRRAFYAGAWAMLAGVLDAAGKCGADVQRRETRPALYGGCWAVLLGSADAGKCGTEEDLAAVLERWREEIEEFTERVRRGEA